MVTKYFGSWVAIAIALALLGCSKRVYAQDTMEAEMSDEADLAGQETQGITSLYLSIGESHRLQVEHGRELKLSRKGIVDLVYDETYHIWTMVALRAGSVSLRILSRDELEAYYYIEVKKRSRSKRLNQIFADADRQAFICQHPQIFCNQDEFSISGQTSSLAWYRKADALCRKAKLCVFQVKLDEFASLALDRLVQNFDASLKIDSIEGGRLLVSRDCQQSSTINQNKLADFLDWPASSLQIRCREPMAQYMVTLSADLQRQHQQDLRRLLTLDSWWQGWSQSSLAANPPVALNEESQSTLLGQPQLVVAVGSEAQVQHGLEFKFESSGTDIESFFRKIGLKMKLKLLAEQDNSLRVRLQISLSQPLQGLQRISSSALETELWIPIGQQFQVGVIDLNIGDESRSSNLFLASVPLIGPLFKQSQQVTGSAKVSILMKASKQLR